jgi:VCBS repeat-containing protein|nr:MAG TPA: Head Tail Connector Protein [Bacteriophage sp.]
MVYADYSYYTNVYWGNSITETDWPRLATRASAFIDYATMGRAAKHAGLDAVKLACCALADDYQTIDAARALANRSLSATSVSGETGELQSQTVGSWSKTYRSGGSSAKEALSATESAQDALMVTAQMYLTGTGLLRARGYYA